MGWPPRASVECTDHILVYGPSKPSSRPSIGGWLCPHCFIGWLGRETRYRPVDRSADMLWIVSRAFFLRSSGSAQLCWWLCKRLLYVDHMRHVWSGTIRGLSEGCVWRVGRISPCMVYIDSNHRDSRIWVTICLVVVFTYLINGIIF
jgi:hypothetical protein